jgi:hypothetical protein
MCGGDLKEGLCQKKKRRALFVILILICSGLINPLNSLGQVDFGVS